MHILITGSVCEYAPYFILKRRMTQEQEIDLKIQKFVAYCKENKLHVEGVEKTYKPDNVFEYENKIIARLAMFRNLQILVELYLEGGIGLTLICLVVIHSQPLFSQKSFLKIIKLM